MIRRLWYLVIGFLAAWAWHRIRRAEPFMVRADVSIPAVLLPPNAAGFGVNVFFAERGEDDDDGGIDESTGLPGFGRPEDAPDGER